MKNLLDFTANPETLKQTPPQHTQKRKVQQHWKNLGNGKKHTHTQTKTTKNRSSSTTNSLIPTTETLQLRWCLDKKNILSNIFPFQVKKNIPSFQPGNLKKKKLKHFQTSQNFMNIQWIWAFSHLQESMIYVTTSMRIPVVHQPWSRIETLQSSPGWAWPWPVEDVFET